MSESREDDDVAWLLARAKGEPGPRIPPARAVGYEKLEALIAGLPAKSADAVPPTDWQKRVLAAIDSQAHAAPTRDGVGGTLRRLKAWLIAIAGAAVAGALVWTVVDPGGTPPGAARRPLVRAAVEASGSKLGANGPALIGDMLIVSASADGPAELRVYDDAHREAGRCATTAQDCAFAQVGARTQIELRVRLERSGVYTSLVFAPPLGGSSEGLDLDVAKAQLAQIATARAETGPVQ